MTKTPLCPQTRLSAFHAAFVAVFLVASVQAAEVGEVRGRVYSSSSASYLNNARVTVKGTSLEAFTDSSGEYVLARVPAGPAGGSARRRWCRR